MYTSGSTGRPKGVMVSHEALLARLAQVPGLEVLAMTALPFDISLAELLLPLTVGGSFVAAPAGTRANPDLQRAGGRARSRCDPGHPENLAPGHGRRLARRPGQPNLVRRRGPHPRPGGPTARPLRKL